MQQKTLQRRKFLSGLIKAGSLLPLATTPGIAKAAAAVMPPPAYPAGNTPDRIVLTVTEDPSVSIMVNWRTAYTVAESYIEYAPADAHPSFAKKVSRLQASSQPLQLDAVSVHYHRITLQQLQPATTYSYRVGKDGSWSEWLDFRTAANTHAPLSFIYLGDAQVGIRDFWSRVIRKACTQLTPPQLIIHAGDLVNRANNDDEWGQWFEAGSFIHASIPGIMAVGNHEYTHEDGHPHLSRFWQPQFGFPKNNIEDPALDDSCYYTDIQNVRFITLNTQMIQEAADDAQILRQRNWLEKTLQQKNTKWCIVTMHHPIYSTKKGRDNIPTREQFKPLFDKYQVDLVLQGHDHAYARGMQQIRKHNSTAPSGTMYVVSVSGAKMYECEPLPWADITAGDQQMYHHITVDKDRLSFRTYLATGQQFDAFDLVKQKQGANKLIIPKQLPRV